MEHAVSRSSLFSRVVRGGMLLFALSLALSKSASNVSIALLCLYTLYASVRSRELRDAMRSHLAQPLLMPLLVYIGIALLGVLYTEHFQDGIGIVNKMAGMALVYFVTAWLLDTAEDSCPTLTEEMLLAFIIGIIGLDFIAFFTYLGIIGHAKYVLPVWPLHVHHIWFANINAVGFYAAGLLLLFSDSGKQKRTRYLLMAFLPLCLLSLLLSLSRTAWLGMLVTIVALSYLLVRERKYFYLLLVGFAIMGLAAYGSNRIVHERIDLISSDIMEFLKGHTRTNIGERFLMWRAAFKMFLSNPMFGVGTGDYVPTMTGYIQAGELPQYFSLFNQPHNMYLFSLATNGLLGLGALLYLFGRVLSFSYRLVRIEGRERLYGCLGFAVMVHYLVGGFTDSFLNIQMLRYTFAFIIALAIRSSLRRNASQTSQPIVIH